ncbi:hypothetical protein [Bifidobacterium pseudolongum]|uniref:hypothetical protein n=1 Tax=Bifidobacterium pseudolongum TaxID=1694 RepID=UPI00101FB0A1|nr:hypothetical protein [Bifidobacterium pseudolongum]RYQ41414.1 hypothetical protein PG1805B_1204 [Bifidobacterium pseudolongum subsp. globosum]
MAREGRQWSDFEIAVSDYLTALREKAGEPSYRRLAELTGIKFSRLRDIFTKQNGTPTLQEFIDLCLTFGKDPADVIYKIMKDLEAKGVSLSNIPAQNDPANEANAALASADNGIDIDAWANQIKAKDSVRDSE